MTKTRLAQLQRSLQIPEEFLVWMTTMQARGGFSEYWKFGTFVSWDFETGDTNFLYDLFFDVNVAVRKAADTSRQISSWASLFGLTMLGALSVPRVEQFSDFRSKWRQQLCTLLEEVIALERGVDIVREVYFDKHEVLFSDVRRELGEMRDRAMLLIAGYNCFAEENQLESIDGEAIVGDEDVVLNLVNQWSAVARSNDLAHRGRLFDARDVLMSWLRDSKLLIR
jgi:hypothetical protein